MHQIGGHIFTSVANHARTISAPFHFQRKLVVGKTSGRNAVYHRKYCSHDKSTDKL